MHLYTQTLWHTNLFTPKHSDTQTRLHTNTFNTQKLIHTNMFKQMQFYVQSLLHTNIFTQQHSYTHTHPFTHKDFYTQKVLHTTLLHRCTCTHKHFYTQTSLHRSSYMWKFGERMYSVLNHLEPTWTSLNLSWNNACACEQLGNHFKFVGTDLWTIEPIGIYRSHGGGSNPCWSCRESQVRPAERQRALTTKK